VRPEFRRTSTMRMRVQRVPSESLLQDRPVAVKPAGKARDAVSGREH